MVGENNQTGESCESVAAGVERRAWGSTQVYMDRNGDGIAQADERTWLGEAQRRAVEAADLMSPPISGSGERLEPLTCAPIERERGGGDGNGPGGGGGGGGVETGFLLPTLDGVTGGVAVAEAGAQTTPNGLPPELRGPVVG